MRINNNKDRLKKLEACGDGRRWVTRFGGTTGQAWKACRRGDWMYWMLEETRFFKAVRLDIRVALAVDVLDLWPDAPPPVRQYLRTRKGISRRSAFQALCETVNPHDFSMDIVHKEVYYCIYHALSPFEDQNTLGGVRRCLSTGWPP